MGVGIEEDQPRLARQVTAQVGGLGKADIALPLNQQDVAIGFSEITQTLRDLLAGPIVDQDEFGDPRVPQHALDAVKQDATGMVDNHDKTDTNPLGRRRLKRVQEIVGLVRRELALLQDFDNRRRQVAHPGPPLCSGLQIRRQSFSPQSLSRGIKIQYGLPITPQEAQSHFASLGLFPANYGDHRHFGQRMFAYLVVDFLVT